ncbi:MAG: hypothetical protein KY443_03640 [Actinobacteria bacterium]|nr:hypothetical protein [Actinomycetota bacterium]
MRLHEVATCQSGDKGDMVNVVVFPNDDETWELLRERLTVDVVREHFGELVRGDVRRYEFRGLQALNFVMDEALGGGVSISLRTDPHGKSYRSLMGELDITPLLEGVGKEHANHAGD